MDGSADPKSGARSDTAAIDWSRTGAGIHVNVISAEALLDDLGARLDVKEGFGVATINLDHVVKLGREAAFCDAYRRQSHVTADGNPIVWLSRLAGHRVEYVPGSELVDPVAALAARRAIPVAFLGSTEEALTRAAERLEARHPGLKVSARIAPPMGFDPAGAAADAALEHIAASGARICFLALGAPKQEILAARGLTTHPGLGFLSIGAGLDFVAGTQTRAPAWVRAIAAEWLWRMLGNPRRLAARYGACIAILPGLTLRALRMRFGGTT